MIIRPVRSVLSPPNAPLDHNVLQLAENPNSLLSFLSPNTRLLLTLLGAAATIDQSGNGNHLTVFGGTFDALGFQTDGVNEHAETATSAYGNAATPALTVTMRHLGMLPNAHIAGEDGKAALTQADALGNLSFAVTDSGGTETATTTTPLLPGTDYTVAGYVDASGNVQLRVHDASGLYTSATSAGTLSGSATTSSTAFTVGALANGSAAYAGCVRQVLAADEAWDTAKADALAAVLKSTLGSQTVTITMPYESSSAVSNFDMYISGIGMAEFIDDNGTVTYSDANDVSFTPSGATGHALKLHLLDVSGAQIILTNLDVGNMDTVNGLTQIDRLFVGNTNMDALPDLSALASMSWLMISGTSIAAIPGLSDLTNLELLTAHSTQNLPADLDFTTNLQLRNLRRDISGLSQSQVDEVIARALEAVQISGVTGGNLRVENNTAPSAQGLADIATLEGAPYNWTVSYDT